MCTIAILHRAHPDYPVVIAANRDEFYARPATGPQRLSDDPIVVGGRDEVGGGTWMALTPAGLFVAVTNQRTYRPPDAARASRGALVVELARAGTRAAIAALLRARPPRAYNELNLLYGDASGLSVAYGRDAADAFEIADVPAGVHVLPNDRLDDASMPKVRRLRDAIDPAAPIETLAATLADHALPDHVEELPPDAKFSRDFVRRLGAVCIHTETYGTRSSAIVALAPGRVARYLFADGPPCTAPLADRTSRGTGWPPNP